MTEKPSKRELIVTKHRTVEKSGEDPVFEVTLKSITKDELTKTVLTVKISTESAQVRDKFCIDDQFTISFLNQPKLGEQ